MRARSDDVVRRACRLARLLPFRGLNCSDIISPWTSRIDFYQDADISAGRIYQSCHVLPSLHWTSPAILNSRGGNTGGLLPLFYQVSLSSTITVSEADLRWPRAFVSNPLWIRMSFLHKTATGESLNGEYRWPIRKICAWAATGSLATSSHGALVSIETVDVTEYEFASEEVAAAMDALESYLRVEKGLQAKDAKFIARNCPVFSMKMLRRVIIEEHENVIDRVVVERWLKKREVHELEPFLESIGMNPEQVDEVLPFLQVPLEGEQGLLRSVEILESIGIPRCRLWDVLERNKQLLTLTPADLRASIEFLEGLGIERGEDLVCLIQDSFFLTDSLTTLKNLQKIDAGVHKICKADHVESENLNMTVGGFVGKTDYLLESGLSKSEVAESLKLVPQLLHVRLENLKRKIQFFDSIGLERERMAKIIERWPLVFRSSVEKKLRPKIEMLQSLGVGRDGMAKILTRYPELGAVSLEDNLKQKVSFFEANGLTGRRLVKLLTSHPRALTLSVVDLNKKLDFLMQKGFTLGSVEMVRALGVCITISVESMEARFLNLESLGFSLEDAREVVKQQPSILTLSEKCIQQKVHYLTQHMTRSVVEIVRCPGYLLYSLELRIKPRHRVLSLLKVKGMLREEAYSLNTIMIMSEKKFMERFVISLGAKSPEVAAVYCSREELSHATLANEIASSSV